MEGWRTVANTYHYTLDHRHLRLLRLENGAGAVTWDLSSCVGAEQPLWYRHSTSLTVMYNSQGLDPRDFDLVRESVRGLGPQTFVFWVDGDTGRLDGELYYLVERMREIFRFLAPWGEQRVLTLRPRPPRRSGGSTY